MDVISLTRQLISLDTINPPGNEEKAALLAGMYLEKNGFSTQYFRYGDNRLHLVAERGLSGEADPVVLSGHFDTVPLGNREWSHDPFSGETDDERIWGRGSSDMKGGLAAMMTAAVESFSEGRPAGGVRLIFTAAEELGCQGVQQLEGIYTAPGKASGLIVGEPTANIPVTGHKGALYLNAVCSGKTAHSSMPHLGDNAIYKAARCLLMAKDFGFGVDKDPLLGLPTINVGKICGGLNINSVPDHAEFTIDVRTTSNCDHSAILEKLVTMFGADAALEILTDLKPVYTRNDNPFVSLVYEVCGVDTSDTSFPRALPYLTDGSVLQKMYRCVPTVILGPGQPEMAHQTDEYCLISKLNQSVKIYKEIILKWRN